MTLTFFEGHSCIIIQNPCIHFLADLSINLDEILYVATACWFVEAYAKFIFHKWHSGERTMCVCVCVCVCV